MFQDEAIERMVLDAFDEMCADAGIEGVFSDEGPKGLALVPNPLRLGAVVDLWMRIENREETVRQGFIERTSILGSHQLDAPTEDEEEENEDGGENGAEGSDDDYVESPEPLLDELELRGRLLVDVLNTISQQLSVRRGALELGEEMPSLDAVRDAMIEAVNTSFADGRLAELWESGAFISDEE
jgi:hypothetical protein